MRAVPSEFAAERAEEAAQLEAVRARLDDAMMAVEARAYLVLDWLPKDGATMEAAGLDVVIADALLRELGEDETWVD